MKNIRTLVWLSLIVLGFTSCRTIDKGSSLVKLRDDLDQAEQWRHTLPAEEKAAVKPKFPHVKTSKLKNGFTIMVVEDKRLPIAAVSLVTKNGSASDPLGKSGLGYLAANMLKEGTSALTSLELAEAFANLGTELTVAVNKDLTNMTAAVLSNKVDDVVSLFAAMLKSPRMASEDFDRVKRQHLSLLASQQGVLSYVAQTSFLLAAYGDKHPYAYPSAGMSDTVSKLTLNDVKAAHQRNFGPNASALVVVGDVTLEQVEKLAKAHFKKWKHKAFMLSAVKDPPLQKQMQTRLVARAHAPQTYLLLGQPAITQKDYDIAGLEVLQYIVAGAPVTSRLNAKLREEKGLTYGVSAGLSPLLGKGPFMVATSIQIPFGADALSDILVEFDRLRREPVSDTELKEAKNGLMLGFAERYTTVNKIANVLAEQFAYDLPPEHHEKIYDKMAQITTNDVMNLANRVLKKENLVAVAVGDLDAIEAPIAKADVGKVIIEREAAVTGP